MPETREYTVYLFDELDDKAKDKARDWWREASAGDCDFAEAIIEDAERLGGLMGITFDTYPIKTISGKTIHKPAVSWELHVQGSGASFSGRYEYAKGSVRAIAAEAPELPDNPHNNEINRIARALADVQKRHLYGLSAKVTAGRQAVHATAADIEVYDRDGNVVYGDVHDIIVDLLRAFMDWIYRGIDEAWSWSMSDEVIDDTIRANEYTFSAKGGRCD